MVKEKFTIPEIHCPSCVMRLEALEDKLEGVKSACACYHKMNLVLEYDENILDHEQIIREIKLLGYDVASIARE